MAEAEARPIKMKELESRTGVSREAIHFYMREGLLPEPERPKRNVAHYSEEHVLRIKAIKRLQEERFLPLGRIKTILEGTDLSDRPAGDALEVFEHQTLALVSGDLPTPSRSVTELSRSSGLTEDDIRDLAAAGVIDTRQAGTRQSVDFRDASIVELWGRLLATGFGRSPLYGPGFLGRYVAALGAIAEQEVDEFLEAFGDLPTGEAAEMAAQGIELSNEIIARMRTQLLLRRLHARTEVGAR